MQRRARTLVTSAALAVALTGGMTACTGSSGDDQADTKPGSTTASPSPAPPGKYRTLPEPCGAVDEGTLENMLPGAAEAADSSGEPDDVATSTSASPYEGEADVTYDTDRRVGCTWESATSLGSRHLSIDFERVVSYDPAVSDDEEAVLLYDERAGQADIAPSSAPSDPQSEDENEGDGGAGDGGSEKTGTGADGTEETQNTGEQDGNTGEQGGDDESGELEEPASPTPDEDLAPRTLSSIGDAAFINDELVTTESSRATHRDITLVFRTSNVLVTVEYTQSVADERRTPDSGELQEKTRGLAQQLAEAFNEE